jgi:hypothetical protein
LLVLSGCLVANEPARAQPASPAPNRASLGETLLGDARADYQAARQQLADHDFAGALVRFTRAYEEQPDPRLLANMGICEQRLQHWARAIALFDQSLSVGQSLFSSDEVSDIRAMVDACRPHVGRLQITVNAGGATIEVDGRPAGQSPLASDVLVDGGAHRVRVTRAGDVDFEGIVPVAEGARVPVDVALAPLAREGDVFVRAGPNDRIVFDGRVVAQGTWHARIAVGTHSLVILADGMEPYRSDVRVEENHTQTFDVTLEPARGAPAWLWATGGVVLLASVIVAAASVFHSTDAASPMATSVASPLRARPR